MKTTQKDYLTHVIPRTDYDVISNKIPKIDGIKYAYQKIRSDELRSAGLCPECGTKCYGDCRE